MRKLVVVDASVALSWLLPGEKTETTLKLRDFAAKTSTVKLLVPPIFWYEIANVLWVAVKRKRLKQPQAKEALAALLDFRFDIALTDPAECISLSFAQNIAVYDSAYLTLAQRYNAPLWTTDKGMILVAKKLNIVTQPE